MKKKYRVLLIDDDTDLCEEIIDYFKDTEFELKTVHNNFDVLKEMEQKKFDCILLDLQMPGMKGEEIFEKMKGSVAELKFAVIVLTGFAAIPTCAKMVRDGVSDFIEKHNLDYDALVDVVRKTIHDLYIKKEIDELKKKNNELKKDNNIVKNFSHGIAHNIKNDLSAISLIAQRLIEKASEDSALDNEYLQQKLDKIVKNVNKSDIVIEKILRFSKDKDDLPLVSSVPVKVNKINEIINESIQIVKDQIFENGVTFSENVSGCLYECDKMLRIDTKLYEDVFTNLIKNSIDAMEEVKERTSELLIKSKATNSHLEISIKDNGKGLSEQNREKVFDQFFTTKSDGLGIGLFWVKEIVETISNGKIICNSEEKKWTEFLITLPFE